MSDAQDFPFSLCSETPVAQPRLTEDMLEALQDPDISAYAPAILSILCESMAESGSHLLRISLNERPDYELTSDSSMLYVLEEVPKLVAWLSENASTRFLLDVETQGEACRIEFIRSESKVRYTIVEDHWKSGGLVGSYSTSAEVLHTSFRRIAASTAAFAASLNSKIETLPAFRNWCEACDCEIG